MNQKKTLELRQTWFLGVMVAVVVAIFAFVILPYFDRGKPEESAFVGKEAPSFGVELLAGGDPGDRVKLGDQRGKVVVLDFFASWCMPCRQQAAAVEQIAREFTGQDVYVLGIGTSDAREALESYLGETKPSYAAGFDEGNVVAGAYGVTGLPTLVVIDRAGRVAFHESRIVDKRELSEVVRTALASQ
jgi:cytochrome c biogenesis protein CcmG/thiol:disulfide interchange protein DsbE